VSYGRVIAGIVIPDVCSAHVPPSQPNLVVASVVSQQHSSNNVVLAIFGTHSTALSVDPTPSVGGRGAAKATTSR